MSRNMSKALGFLAALCIVGVHASQVRSSITVESKVDRATIFIGDRVMYTVTVKRTPDVVVEMPSLGAHLGMFELRDYTVKEPVKQGGLLVEQTEYVISTFETGDFEIPPLTIRYYTAADTTRKELRTEPIKITVQSLNPDQAGDIRDIKPPLEIPRDWGLVARRVGLGVAAVLVLALAAVAFVRYRKGKSILPKREKPPRPAHEVALEELDALAHEGLLEAGQVKEFYSRLSEIVRRYIENRFYVDALEMTTAEVMAAMDDAALGDDELRMLRELLELSDLVKFAKYVPAEEEHKGATEAAYEFVHRTKLIVTEVTQHAEPGVLSSGEPAPELPVPEEGKGAGSEEA
ncbi:MAG: BatD family protein [candidate division KSB1 bacterium]|nr:BatD family protein [candidate division KSB1 bacterium]